jgi:hypothetical protein
VTIANRATALIKAINDRSSTTIGDPWRGTYHVAIDVTDSADTQAILSDLEALGVTHRVNTGARDRIAIYDLDSLKKLLELGDELSAHVHERLQTLVSAKGPVPEVTRNFIGNQLSMNRSPESIAAELNERRASRGMGGKGWTAGKVKAAARGDIPRRLRDREAA